jgi:long-chain fatty acid transport protein
LLAKCNKRLFKLLAGVSLNSADDLKLPLPIPEESDMMQNTRFKLSALAIATAMACSSAAYATNGYFKHGYGQKSEGMGGVGVALPQDSIAEATNPAGLAFVDNRADLGMELFNPRRDASLDLSGGNGGAVSADSGATLFLIPEAGFAMKMADMTMGLAMVGNGGMNTRYGTNIYDLAFSPTGTPSGARNTGTLGMNLAQLLILPSVAYKLNDSNAIGASLIVGYQAFRAYGLGDFAGFSNDQNNMTNKGNDSAWGGGVRLGWTGKITDTLTLGATAASKVYMQKFTRYQGLFAGQGAFDIPANYAVGLAYAPTKDWTAAFDVERILYAGVNSVSNPGPTANDFFGGAGAAPGTQLGLDGGMGFGWEDMTVYKLGISYNYNDQWTLRGGFNYGKSPIPSDQNLFNIIAPGVVEKHLTLGFTFSPSKSNEITVAATHAFRQDQSYVMPSGLPPAPTNPPSITTNIGMSQNILGASYAWKF